jgi:hypothetical protein
MQVLQKLKGGNIPLTQTGSIRFDPLDPHPRVDASIWS